MCSSGLLGVSTLEGSYCGKRTLPSPDFGYAMSGMLAGGGGGGGGSLCAHVLTQLAEFYECRVTLRLPFSSWPVLSGLLLLYGVSGWGASGCACCPHYERYEALKVERCCLQAAYFGGPGPRPRPYGASAMGTSVAVCLALPVYGMTCGVRMEC